MIDLLEMSTQRRDLSVEAVDGLNEDLGAIRVLYSESDVALDGVYRAKKLIGEDLQKALIEGKVPVRDPSVADILRESADSLDDILAKRVLFGARATEFMAMLDKFLITKSDGTSLEGSLNPRNVDGRRGEERYKGDDSKLPRLYVAGISGLPNYPRETTGRVVTTMYQPYRVAQGREDFPFGVWVWPNDLDEWTNGSRSGTRFVDFLEDPEAQFVQHVKGATLPKPKDYDPKYQIGID